MFGLGGRLLIGPQRLDSSIHLFFCGNGGPRSLMGKKSIFSHLESKPKIIWNFFFNYFSFVCAEKNFWDTIDVVVNVIVVSVVLVGVIVVVRVGVAVVLPEIKDKSRSKILFFSS